MGIDKITKIVVLRFPKKKEKREDARSSQLLVITGLLVWQSRPSERFLVQALIPFAGRVRAPAPAAADADHLDDGSAEEAQDDAEPDDQPDPPKQLAVVIPRPLSLPRQRSRPRGSR